MKINKNISTWLMTGDPAIRWQVQMDLLEEPPDIYLKEREKIANQGWGKKLLDEQDLKGTWGGGLYSPKWISTTYTLLALRRLGLSPANKSAEKACGLLLNGGFYETDGGINFSVSYKYSETCITGMILSILAYFNYQDPRIHRVKDHLLTQQLPDGGWNCRSFKGDTHSSFHTTISALEGLVEYQRIYPKSKKEISDSREKAHEFLLQHKLYKSHQTGAVVDPRMTRYPFPPRWKYDILRALDYFQAANANPDDRMKDAIDLLKSKQNKQEQWPAYRGPSGRVFFDLEPAGKPSKFNTLRVLRVLNWWQKCT